MKKIILVLCALLVITCSAITAEEEKENCFFIELESGEVIEICDDDLGISPCGLGIPCEHECW